MRRLIPLILLATILVGCGKEEVKIEEPPISSVYTTLELGSSTIGTLGSYSGVVYITGTKVEIHPYYNLEECVTVTSILLSENDWWNGALKDLGDTAVTTDYNNYQITVVADGTTYGFMKLNETEAIIAETTNLPSSYVKLVLDKIWFTDT